MLNIELTSWGLDDTLKEIMRDLENVLGNNNSKKRKDEVIYKTLGAVNAIWNMVTVTESNVDTEVESE